MEIDWVECLMVRSEIGARKGFAIVYIVKIKSVHKLEEEVGLWIIIVARLAG